MAESYKYSQAQGTSSTGTYTTLYTVPSATESIVSSLVVCNQSTSDITTRIALDDTTASVPSGDEFLVYDAVIAGNDTVALTLGICMDAGKHIRVASSASACSFTAFVSEIS